MKREKAPAHDPRSFPADAAEVRGPRPCVICGRLTVSVPPKDGHPTCAPTHTRLAAEAQAGTSRSTVLLLGPPGMTLALRAYAREGPLGKVVRFVACEATPAEVAITGGDLTPREARRLAGALLRAAEKAEGRQREVAQA